MSIKVEQHSKTLSLLDDFTLFHFVSKNEVISLKKNLKKKKKKKKKNERTQRSFLCLIPVE